MNRNFAPFVAGVANMEFSEAIKLTALYPLLELRLDLLEWSLAEITSFMESAENIIITLRPEGELNSDADRIKKLEALDWSGIDYLDIEVESSEEYISWCRQKARNHGVQIILSTHDFDEMIDTAEFLTQHKNSIAENDIVKIACLVGSEEENVALMDGYRLRENLILIGMGEMGKTSRLMGVQLGAPFMYGFPEQSEALAPGQVSVEEMETFNRLMQG